MKSQVAIEYLLIVSFGLMVLLPYSLYLHDLIRSVSESTRLSLAKASLEKLGESIDWVFSQGEPAKLIIHLYIPEGTEEIVFLNNTIVWKVKTSSGISELAYNSLANISGKLPTKSAYYPVEIRAIENGVEVSVWSSE